MLQIGGMQVRLINCGPWLWPAVPVERLLQIARGTAADMLQVDLLLLLLLRVRLWARSSWRVEYLGLLAVYTANMCCTGCACMSRTGHGVGPQHDLLQYYCCGA